MTVQEPSASSVRLASTALPDSNVTPLPQPKPERTLAAVEVESAGIANERQKLAADTGPVRYLAALIGQDDEKVMHWFVLAVALLLDPLAVALLLAASASGDCAPARGTIVKA